MDRWLSLRSGVMICFAASLASLLALVGTAQDAHDGQEQLREEVLEEVRQYYVDFSARDWERFADHFWPRATLATIWQLPESASPTVFVSTVPEFVAKAPEGPGSKPIFEETMTDAQVRVAGSLAQVWANYDARFGDPGDVMEWSGIDAFTLLKHEGRWRIVTLAYVPEE